MNIDIETLIETMIYESEGFDTLMQPLMNVKNSRGETYQIQLIVTKDQSEISDVTCFSDMRIYDGQLVEDL